MSDDDLPASRGFVRQELAQLRVELRDELRDELREQLSVLPTRDDFDRQIRVLQEQFAEWAKSTNDLTRMLHDKVRTEFEAHRDDASVHVRRRSPAPRARRLAK